MAGQIKWKKIKSMLNTCLTGWHCGEGDHYKCIYHVSRNEPYYNFPLGEHGPRKNVDIQKRHVRKLINHFDIKQCAKSQLPQL